MRTIHAMWDVCSFRKCFSAASGTHLAGILQLLLEGIHLHTKGLHSLLTGFLVGGWERQPLWQAVCNAVLPSCAIQPTKAQNGNLEVPDASSPVPLYSRAFNKAEYT